MRFARCAVIGRALIKNRLVDARAVLAAAQSAAQNGSAGDILDHLMASGHLTPEGALKIEEALERRIAQRAAPATDDAVVVLSKAEKADSFSGFLEQQRTRLAQGASAKFDIDEKVDGIGDRAHLLSYVVGSEEKGAAHYVYFVYQGDEAWTISCRSSREKAPFNKVVFESILNTVTFKKQEGESSAESSGSGT